MVVITSWSIILSGTYFFVLHKIKRLRVPLVFEIVGIDFLEHGGLVAQA